MSEIWTCTRCGSQCSPSFIHCPVCGTSKSSPNQRQRRITAIAILIGLIALAGIGSLFEQTHKRNTNAGFAYAPSPTPDTLTPRQHLDAAKSEFAVRSAAKSLEHLNAIPSTALEHKEAQKLRSKVDALVKEQDEKMQLQSREAFVDFAERHFLDAGFDMHVSLSGQNKTTVTFKYVLMSRPTVYQITKDGGFMDQLRSRGFRKVIFTDGYDESWTVGL